MIAPDGSRPSPIDAGQCATPNATARTQTIPAAPPHPPVLHSPGPASVGEWHRCSLRWPRLFARGRLPKPSQRVMHQLLLHGRDCGRSSSMWRHGATSSYSQCNTLGIIGCSTGVFGVGTPSVLSTRSRKARPLRCISSRTFRGLYGCGSISFSPESMRVSTLA